MIFYSQTNGIFTADDGTAISEGWYAGGKLGMAPVAVNNPAYQYVIDTGPLPQAVYTMSPLHTVQRIGPCMALTPEDPSVMGGRGGFLFHLNNPSRPPRSSSDGCAVAPSMAELEKIEALRAGGETQVTVTA